MPLTTDLAANAGSCLKKVCPAYCARAEGLQSGDSAKKSLQTMLLVGKRLCRKGRKMQSAMFFTIFCRWVVGKEGQKSVVDVVCVLGWYSLKPSST